MRIFFDTSALFKKYVDEAGSDIFEQELARASEVAVSPTTWIEMAAAIERRLRNSKLLLDEADKLRAEIKKDFNYFAITLWNERLENTAAEIVRLHPLKAMDAIQLAAGLLSDSELFVTSDRELYTAAKKTLKDARLI